MIALVIAAAQPATPAPIVFASPERAFRRSEERGSANAGVASAMEVARLITIPVNFKTFMETSFEHNARQGIGAAPQTAGFAALHPNDVTAAIAAGRAELDHLIDTVVMPAAWQAAADVYKKNYTPAELAKLRDFYSSREGQIMFHETIPYVVSSEANTAANSPRGAAFLKSPLGKRENGGVYHMATEAGAAATRAKMADVIPIVRKRVLASLAASGAKVPVQ